MAFDAAMYAYLVWMSASNAQRNAQAIWLNQRADTVDAAAAAAGSIGALASTAAASAAAAAAARDAALAAWVASTYPAETLASVSTGLHSGAIVCQIVYDTSKDSDGGAWRKRCQHTSWYAEAPGFTGKWLGQNATTAAAWATSGAAAGDGFQNTTDGKFYGLTGTSTASEIFRGNVREFPALVGIVAEAARVVIYDLTQPGCPMWMVFNGVSDSATTLLRIGNSSVAASNATLLVGSNGSSGNNMLAVVNFLADSGVRIFDSSRQAIVGGLVTRNATSIAVITSSGVVNRMVADVAITALDTAPIDAATGLPVPTIAVATAGGVSVIKDDGTVVNSASTASANGIGFDYQRRLSWLYSNLATRTVPVELLGASFASVSSATPMVADASTTYSAAAGYVSGALAGTKPVQVAGAARGGTSGLERYLVGNSTAKTQLAAITNTYNSGWMVGDIRGAWLADSTAETITGSGELVTNGTFTTDTSGWTTGGISTLSVVSGKMRVTQTAPNGGAISNAMATVVGCTYYATSGFTKTTQNAVLSVTNNSSGSGSFASVQMTATGTYVLSFVATASATYLVPYINGGGASDIADFDNISVKLAEPDRSVKNKGLIVNGSLNKTAVASGAGLVAYSGFSATNYLEQHYNSDLDFGTGDFYVMGWLEEASNTASEIVFSRGYHTGSAWSGSLLQLNVQVDGTLRWYVSDDGAASADIIIGPTVDDNNYKLVWLIRRGSNLELWINDTKAATDVALVQAVGSLSNTNATTRLGVSQAVATPGPLTNGSLALWRIGATAPSADQIAHIYRTELPLFQANAQCTLAGTSTAVTTLAYDDDTTLLHVGTSWGRSTFKDLLRVESEATTTGALTSLSASGGVILTGGTSGKVYMPALLLRDELRRKAEARKALGRVPVFFDYTATASQTVFPVPKGYTVKALCKNGTLMRETTTGVYWTRSNDGFAETATLSVGASASDWISLMCVRA